MREINKNKPRDPKRVQKVLNDQEALKAILQKAKALLAIDQRLQKLLPTEITVHCRVMNLNNNRLIIEVDSAAWATTLRFIEAELLAQLRTMNGLENLSTLKYRVRS